MGRCSLPIIPIDSLLWCALNASLSCGHQSGLATLTLAKVQRSQVFSVIEYVAEIGHKGQCFIIVLACVQRS